MPVLVCTHTHIIHTYSNALVKTLTSLLTVPHTTVTKTNLSVHEDKHRVPYVKVSHLMSRFSVAANSLSYYLYYLDAVGVQVR